MFCLFFYKFAGRILKKGEILFAWSLKFRTNIFAVTEHADIVSNWFNLRHNHEVLNNPSHNVDAGPHPVVWSNYGGWNIAETVWNAKYTVKQKLPITNSSHYIKAFVYGIIEASTELNFSKITLGAVGHAEMKTKEIIQKYDCPFVSKSNPASSNFECRKNFSLELGSEPFIFSIGDMYV